MAWRAPARAPSDAVGAGKFEARLEQDAQPFTDEGQSALRFEFVTGRGQGAVELPNASAQDRVSEVRTVYGGADEALLQHRRIEVDDALAEPVRGGGGAVVRNLGREQAHGAARGAAPVAVQVVADSAVIDDQQGPLVVDVHGVRVRGETGVENLDDTRDPRAPGRDFLLELHAKNVQDRARPSPAVSRP